MKRIFSFALALIMTLSLAACGGGQNTAATMHLRRTEGTVAVFDGGGKDVPVMDNLGLYSGYGVGTRSTSYAWIDLDGVKLAKLDQNSEIAIRKEGKKLDIEVRSGSLFFNVTQPLEDDETMNISTSTMLVGIRGTCGWVEDNAGLSRVYLLAGKVECSAEGQTVRVSAGQMAELAKEGELTVQEFDEEDLPVFVRDEVDPDLPGGTVETPGPDGSDTPEPTPTPKPASTPTPTQEPQGVTWTLNNGTLTISGTGPMEDYTYDNMPWKGERDSITEVVIEDGVTSIGERAFERCSVLASVSIPDSVTDIGRWAFSECGSLTGVAIPNSVTYIENRTFYKCSSLANVTIPDSVTGIGEFALYECTSLTGVTIPNSVTSIGQSAFAYSGLTSLIIPDSVTSIGKSAFYHCDSLSSVSIPDSVTSIEYGAFQGCGSLTDVYYSGSESRWAQISIGNANYPLLNADIHCNG